MTEEALSGLKILEYCTMISGPYCTKLMADLGAEVVKIESPDSGDGAREHPPFPGNITDPEKSGLFHYLNTNKLGITLNPMSLRGSDIFKTLIKDTDVLVTDRPLLDLEKASLGYDDLKSANPALIMASLTPFGLSGPYKDHKAYQLNTSHASGQGYQLPIPALDPKRPPVISGGNATDYEPGLVAAVAIMAAYFRKGLTGQGQFIEVSKQEALLAMLRVEAVTYANDGVMQTPRLPGQIQARMAAPAGVIPCKDGYFVLVTPEEHQFKSLVTLMDNPEWSKEPWCKNPAERSKHSNKVGEYIWEWAKMHTQEEIFRKGQALSIPVAPLQSAKNVVESEQFNATGFFAHIDHPSLGSIKFPTAPYRFSKSPWQLRRAAPSLGEHNMTIFCERLGIDKIELNQLKKSGII